MKPEDIIPDVQTVEADPGRRKALKVLGAGSLAIACMSFLPNLGKVYATDDLNASSLPSTDVPHGSQNMLSVANVAELRALSSPKDGMTVQVLGYSVPGDMGAKTMVYFASSTAPENGGTVHKPKNGKGAWHLVHTGVGRFAWFGIHDAKTPADDALDALVNDESFRRIEADSDLLMLRRHVFHRSRLDLDFLNHTMYTYGAENARRDDPFAAILFFQGRSVGKPLTVTLPELQDESGFFRPAQFGEDSDFLYVGDNSTFSPDQWYFVQSDSRPQEPAEDGRMPVGGGSADIELMKLLMVTKVGNALGDKKYVEFNYLNAWPLTSGRTITYQRIEPVFDVNVMNLKFEGQGHSDVTGTSPVAHEYCVNCNVLNIEARKVFWPLNIRRYCTTYEVRGCTLINPEEVITGGSGYMLQQIGCLYGHVTDCRSHNVRHLNDFTGCAYSMVENCHCTGDENGAFVTHGQYDHDLTYVGNSGLLSFANSALNATSPHNWGGWHKRILVKKHVAPRVVFEGKMNRVVDMTLEDCYVYRNAARYGANAGSVWANVDGLVMRNCVLQGFLCLGEDSNISRRPTLVENCTINLIDGNYLTRYAGSKYEVDREITFRNCVFLNTGKHFIVRGSTINFIDCHFYPAEGTQLNRLNVEAKHTRIIGGGLHGVCFAFDKGETTETEVGPQILTLDGGVVLDGANPSGALIDIQNPALVTLDFGTVTLSPAEGVEIVRAGTGPVALMARGTRLENAHLSLPASARGQGSYFIAQNCILKNSSIRLPEGASVTGSLSV